MSGNVPMSQSSGHDRCGWDVEYGQLCTVTPGVLTPTANLIVLCPPEQGCTDAVAHRADGTGMTTTIRTGMAVAIPGPRYPSDGGSAGTAGRGYRVDPAEHPYAPDAVEPGRDPRCRECGQTRHEKAAA